MFKQYGLPSICCMIGITVYRQLPPEGRQLYRLAAAAIAIPAGAYFANRIYRKCVAEGKEQEGRTRRMGILAIFWGGSLLILMMSWVSWH
jgi:hypothetical protein